MLKSARGLLPAAKAMLEKASRPPEVARASSRTRRELVAFLIGLGERNPAAPIALAERPGDALNLAQDLMRFGLIAGLQHHPGLTTETIAARIAAHPGRTLGPIICEVRKLLAAVADGETYRIGAPRNATLTFDGHALKIFESVGFRGRQAWRMGAGSIGNPLTFALTLPPEKLWSSLAAVFVFTAMRALDSEQGVMVRRCRREACPKIFLAALPKQVYCSRRCNGAVAAKTHRDKVPDYHTEHAEQARKSYYRVRGKPIPDRVFNRT
jgi:hypothetical protein